MQYLAPGVYVEEVPSGVRPIEGVSTSTAGFVGVAPATSKRVNELVWVENWSQFLREFATDDAKSTPLSQAVFGFFQNGGARCGVVNVGADKSGVIGDGTPKKGIGIFDQYDDISIIAAPGATDAKVYGALLDHCEKRKDRVAVLDGPRDVTDIDALTRTATVSAKGEGKGEGDAAGFKPRQSDGGYGAFYFPWITVRDPMPPYDTVDVAPSGHIAGIYARTDVTQGVHVAPANKEIRGALDLSRRVTRTEQEKLNPNGVNCIRYFPGEGIRVYGARTLAASASEWRYLNVRRLFVMIEESIARSTRWVVFEPNDRPLWKSIRRDVSAFLTLIWRQGALMGRTPEEAFFVQCDEETNPPEVIDAGRVVTVIGLAPVKPAEFVIFKIGQGVGGTTVE
jgi:uncharacterized protein